LNSCSFSKLLPHLRFLAYVKELTKSGSIVGPWYHDNIRELFAEGLGRRVERIGRSAHEKNARVLFYALHELGQDFFEALRVQVLVSLGQLFGKLLLTVVDQNDGRLQRLPHLAHQVNEHLEAILAWVLANYVGWRQVKERRANLVRYDVG